MVFIIKSPINLKVNKINELKDRAREKNRKTHTGKTHYKNASVFGQNKTQTP